VVNEKLFNMLTEKKFDVFLPKKIDIDAVTFEEQLHVSTICYDEIEKCDLMVIVYPFGISVACEIGYAIYQKRQGSTKKLILLNLKPKDKILQSEAMLIPYIDSEVNSIEEVIKAALLLAR